MTAAITSTETETRCLRCGRKLRAAGSVKARYGRGCQAVIRREAREHALEGLKSEQRDKAVELVTDGGVIATAHNGVYRVVNSKGDGYYLTALTGNCSCPHGLRAMTAKPCYHAGAVKLVALKPRRSLAKAA